MEIVKPTNNLESLNQNIKDDFYIVPNLKFDVDKLRADLNVVLKKKKFNTLGIKNFGAISIFLQSAYLIHSTHTVSASCFYPKPKVDSILIRLDLKQNAICFSNKAKALIRTIFTQRRKQIASLFKKSDNEDIEYWLKYLFTKGYAQSVRAEAIDLSSWQLLGYEKTNES